MHEFAIPLGVRAREKITGIEGLVTARVQYITGCDQYLIQPSAKGDGGYVEPHWFDEQRLQVIGSKVLRLDNAVGSGPDRPAPKK